MACLGDLGGYGVAQMGAKGNPMHIPKAWLKGFRLEVCVCLRNSTLEAFH